MNMKGWEVHEVRGNNVCLLTTTHQTLNIEEATSFEKTVALSSVHAI